MIGPYLDNSRDLNVHLRDARHANQIVTEYSHAFTAKTKFLFHVSFQTTNEVAVSNLLNTSTFNKQIGVLAKSAELPKFRASTEVVNQYNRKKVVQTRVDYDGVNINFYDDNLGVTRSLLEEYYRYYVKDPSHRPDNIAYDARDKYSNAERIPNYGLNNQRNTPFFSYIKLYQLSRQEWFSYTLVNPMLTAWNHDQVDAADGSSLMENQISVAYEGVLYDHGFVGEFSEPLGFADPDAGYDVTPSPLTLSDAYQRPTGPAIGDPGVSGDLTYFENIGNETNFFNEVATDGSTTGGSWFDSVVKGATVPTGADSPASYYTGSLLDPADLIEQLNNDDAARANFITRSLLTGELGFSRSEYLSGSDAERAAISELALEKIRTSEKIKVFAQEALGL